MTAEPLRDPETGEPRFKVSINVHLTGKLMPLVYDAADWKAARGFLASAEFRRMADRVKFVTITNRNVSGEQP